jgi:hypothetical protein
MMNAKLQITLFCLYIFVLAGLISAFIPKVYWDCLVIGLIALSFAACMWIVYLVQRRQP